MPELLVDVNIEGHGALIAARLQSLHWQEFAIALDVSLVNFGDVGLDPASRDDVVWNFCQAHGYYLLTSNRHEDGVDSLGMTIRLHNSPTSLPVFTIAFPDRIYSSQVFLDRVVEKLFDYLLDPDNLLGTGRLYLP